MNPDINNDVAIKWGELIETLIEGFYDKSNDIETKLTNMGCTIIKQKAIPENEYTFKEKDTLGDVIKDKFISVLVPDEYYFDLIRIAHKHSFFMSKVTDVLIKERSTEYVLRDLSLGFYWPSCSTTTYMKGDI